MVTKELNTVKKCISDFIEDLLPDKYLSDFILNGSKYIRSRVALLFVMSQTGYISDNLYNVLAAGELIHNASLLHDDVIDSAKTRRGKTTLGEKFSYKVSILSGDYVISRVVELLNNLGNRDIIKIFNSAIQNMTKAEIKQFFDRGIKVSKDEYLKICAGKTGSLFSAILESAARVENIPIENAKHFGELFGTAFQINNDLNLESASADKANGIYTAIDVLGVENTKSLLDNYKREMLMIVSKLDKNKYSEELKDLVNNL